MREGGGERDGRREREREFGIRFSPRYRGLNEEEGRGVLEERVSRPGLGNGWDYVKKGVSQIAHRPDGRRSPS